LLPENTFSFDSIEIWLGRKPARTFFVGWSIHIRTTIYYLFENGIALNLALHFWDKAGHAAGEELSTPRF
jgi:hypothetical protein